MKRYIPNLFTCGNVFSGCIASVMAIHGEFKLVVFFVILGAICDFLDGFMARILKSYSPLGKELDSLADMLTFGLVPGLVVWQLLNSIVGQSSTFLLSFVPYIAFLLTIFSALRLAKFNIDERQTSSFIGLPTPANALFWVSVCYGLDANYKMLLSSDVAMWIIVALVLVFSFLLTAEIPMFSLKISSLKLRGNELRYILAVSMIAAVIWLGVLGVAVGILIYILLSLVTIDRISR